MRSRVYKSKEDAQAACLRYIERNIDSIKFSIDEVEDGWLLLIKEKEDVAYEKSIPILQKASELYKAGKTNEAVEYILNNFKEIKEI